MYGDEVGCFLSQLIGCEDLVVFFVVLEVLESQDSGLGLGSFCLSLS